MHCEYTPPVSKKELLQATLFRKTEVGSLRSEVRRDCISGFRPLTSIFYMIVDFLNSMFALFTPSGIRLAT